MLLGLVRFFAGSVKIQGVVVDVYAKDLFQSLLDAVQTRIAKFNYFAAVGHDDVVVLLVEIRLFIMRLILAKLMSAHQAAFEQ